MPNYCSVFNCKSTGYLSKKSSDEQEEIRFFRFPKNPVLIKKWLVVTGCEKMSSFSIKSARVCSKHFLKDDFEDQLRAEMLNYVPKKLKSTAVPSLHLSEDISAALVLETLNPIVNSPLKEPEKEPNDSQDISQNTVIEQFDPDELQQEIAEMKIKMTKNYGNFEAKLKALNNENKLLKEKLIKAEKQLKENDTKFEEQAKEAFKEFLSNNQVDIALKKKTKARWSNDDLSRAFTLRYLGVRSYVYLRETLKYPLPALSTLRKWANNDSARFNSNI